MSALRVCNRTQLAVRWANGLRVGKPAIQQTRKSAVRGKSPSPVTATDRLARAGSPPSFFLYQHPEGVATFNLLTLLTLLTF
jgi:hypothetical protein